MVTACSYRTPLLSVLVSSVYLDLPVRPQHWLAGLLVVAGAAVCRLAQRDRLPEEKKSRHAGNSPV